MLFIIFVLPAFLPHGTLAAELASEGNAREEDGFEEEIEAYEFPEIRPDLSVTTGYRFAGFKGSARAGEYEDPHNSVILGEELRAFSFPHRLHLDIDLKSKRDFLGEATYAFKDLVYFRGINRTLFHNLDNITLRDLEPSTPSPGVDITDAGNKYGVKTGISNFFLGFKAPDFPAHFYMDAGLVERKGTQQQISLAGSGYFNDIVKKSRARGVDWQTKNVVVGANSHLGPVELDIAHSEKRFDAGGDRVLFGNYTAADSIPPRGAGTYPRNLVPELRGSSDTIKLHTSYTGGLVATATLSRMERENSDSGARADYLTGAGELIWLPATKLTFFLRYRHRETDFDNPDTVTLRDITDPSNSFTYGVRPSISSRTDTTSLAMRYRLSSFITLRPEYAYETTDRKNAGLWSLPDSTQRHIFSLSADSRVLKSLSLKAGYTHTETDDPAYNTEPDRSDEGRLSLSWQPGQRINTLLTYSLASEKRTGIRFVDEEGKPLFTPGDRDVLRDKLFANILFILRDNLSLSTSFAGIRSKTKQDLVILTGLDPLAHGTDALVPYREKSHNYAVDLAFSPQRNTNISTGVSHTVGSARFHPASNNLLEPVPTASFSDFRTRETVFLVSGEHRFKGELKFGATYKFCTVRDALSNTFDDIDNGTAHILVVTVTKRF